VGRRIRRVIDADLSSGRHEVGWDGRDDAGRLLPSGIFLYRVETPDRRQTVKIRIIR
jgi:hypothetical protein